MVKPKFENIDVDLWVHPKNLGVAQPSVCLFHRDRHIGTQLLDALSELENADCPAQRTVTFRSCSRELALRKLSLKLDTTCEGLKVMHIGHDGDRAIITMTHEGLLLLTKALTLWFDGGEDFGISPRHSALKPKEFGKLDKESGELWFWGPGYVGP